MTPLLLDALAVHRLTRLVTADSITQPVRERVIEFAYTSAGGTRAPFSDGPQRWQEAVEDDRAQDMRIPRLADLVTCRWCSSLWCALLVVALRRLAPRLWDPLAKALALSSAATLLAGLEE